MKQPLLTFEPVPSRKGLYGQLIWFLFWAGTTAFAIYLKPNAEGHSTHTQLGLAPCPSALLLHRPCPGCGLTTSFTATVHGNLPLAFSAHPLGPILYALFTVTALLAIYNYAKSRFMNTNSKTFSRALGGFIAVFLVFSAIRFAVVSNYGPYGMIGSVTAKSR